MKIAILIAGVLSLAATVRMALASGLTNNNTIMLAGITALLGLYGWFFERLKTIKWLTMLICVGFFSLLGFSIFLGTYGRRSTVNYDEDVVLVLGGGIRQGEVQPTLQMRLDTALAYHRRNPYALIIVTGGMGHREYDSEAAIMARYLIAHGVPAERILLEDAAYSTFTNMTYSRVMLDEIFDGPFTAVVVTSDFHMFRSAAFARRVGIEAVRYPSGTPWHAAPFYYLREVAAVVKMWVIGR